MSLYDHRERLINALWGKTCNELRGLCRQLRMVQGGRKAEMIHRLTVHSFGF